MSTITVSYTHLGIRKDLKEKITFEFPEAHDYKPVLRDILENVPESVGAVSYTHLALIIKNLNLIKCLRLRKL